MRLHSLYFIRIEEEVSSMYLCIQFIPVYGLWVDSNEAGTLLVGLGPHAFDQFELLPGDEGTILLSPVCNTASPACI